jgi:hypothetical protein
MLVPVADYTLDSALLPRNGPCPMACIHNHVEWQGECIPCNGRIDAGYSVFSHWNATPAAGVRRSGKCLPCPLGFGVLPGDTDLCMLLPGFGDTTGSVTVQPIPSLGEDLYIVYKDQRPSITGLQRTRRLLLQAAASGGSDVVRVCPAAYFNDRSSDQCAACPAGMSTYAAGSTGIEDCRCLPGHSPSSGGCTACPADTFRGKEDTYCRPCPPGETTFGKSGSAACGCHAGTVRRNDVCVPCPANTFCYPCWDTQRDCSEANQFDCFPLGISPPSSTSIQNCSCGSGLTRLVRPMGDPKLASTYYCVRPPPNSVLNAAGTGIACKAGWASVWEKNQLVACTLCSPGYYYYSANDADDFIGGACTPCPVGTYTGVSDTIGACTPCPCGGSGKLAAVGIDDGCNLQCLSAGEPDSCQPNAVSVLGNCLCDKGHYLYNQTACLKCPIGTFSPHVSNAAACGRCPEGATTADAGASRRGLCGATEELCLKPAYVFIGPGICRRA